MKQIYELRHWGDYGEDRPIHINIALDDLMRWCSYVPYGQKTAFAMFYSFKMQKCVTIGARRRSINTIVRP